MAAAEKQLGDPPESFGKSPEAVGDGQMAHWRDAVAKAYAVLWCVNNEPGTPHLYSPEKGAYEARKHLRDLLTHEERGRAINAAIACGCRPGECESKPAPIRCRMADEIGDRSAQ